MRAKYDASSALRMLGQCALIAATLLPAGCQAIGRGDLSEEQVPPPSDNSASMSPAVEDHRAASPSAISLANFEVAADQVGDGLQFVPSELIQPPQSPMAPAPPSNALTLANLEARALTMHPSVMAARARVDSASGQFVQAGLPFNPTLQYQADEVGNEAAGGLHSLSMSQQIVTANKLDIAQQVQAYEMRKRGAQLQVAQLQVITNVRTAFLQAFIAQRRVELAHQIVEISNKSIESVQALFEARNVSKIALLQAQVEGQQASIAAENAAAQLQANRQALAAAVGTQVLPDAPLVGDLGAELTEEPWKELLDLIVTASPQLGAADAELRRARWALQLACAQVTPNITGRVGVGVNVGSDDTFATVQLSVPLPIRNRNQGNILTAQADITAAAADIDRTRLDLQSRFAEAVGRYRTARQRHQRLVGQVLPNAEETFSLSQQAFDAGEIGILQLLIAQRTLFTTRLNALEALLAARQAQAEIEGLLVTLQ